jgi:hypothetical protein
MDDGFLKFGVISLNGRKPAGNKAPPFNQAGSNETGVIHEKA